MVLPMMTLRLKLPIARREQSDGHPPDQIVVPRHPLLASADEAPKKKKHPPVEWVSRPLPFDAADEASYVSAAAAEASYASGAADEGGASS
mmetsp:Transcript_39033/g.79904  ORF Transcript_39033/g.79904 Transcript_39033/m.79904 type:complete len:91 (-) Transcript_39033:916-1188(-)